MTLKELLIKLKYFEELGRPAAFQQTGLLFEKDGGTEVEKSQ